MESDASLPEAIIRTLLSGLPQVGLLATGGAAIEFAPVVIPAAGSAAADKVILDPYGTARQLGQTACDLSGSCTGGEIAPVLPPIGRGGALSESLYTNGPTIRAYRGTMNFTGELVDGLGSVTQRFPKYLSTDSDAALGAVNEHLQNLPSVYRYELKPDPGVIGAEFPESVWQQLHDEGHFLTRPYGGWGVTNSTETQILTPYGASVWNQYVNYGWPFPLRPGG